MSGYSRKPLAQKLKVTFHNIMLSFNNVDYLNISKISIAKSVSKPYIMLGLKFNIEVIIY